MFAPDDGDRTNAKATPEGGFRPGRPIDLARLGWALRSRWRWVAAAFAASIPLGAALALLVPRTFATQTVLLWEPPAHEQGQDPYRALRTLVDTVKLRGNIEETGRRLKLSMPPDVLAARIDARPGKESNVLVIGGQASDPDGALQLTQTITQVFMENHLNDKRERAKALLAAVNEEIAHIEESLKAVREQQDRFQADNGIIDLTLERQVAIQEMAFLRTEAQRSRINAESEATKAEFLRAAAKGETPTVILTETQIRAEERKLAELRAELSAREAAFTPEHPEILGLTAAIETLEGAPAGVGVDGGTPASEEPGNEPAGSYTSAERVVGTNPQWTFLQRSLAETTAERGKAQQMFESYSKLGSTAQGRLAKLAGAEAEASRLRGAMSVLETRLHDLSAQQKMLEGEIRMSLNELRVIAPASHPQMPVRSRRGMVAVLFVLLSGLLATAFCAGQALRGLKLWTPSEFAFWARVPVVAASTWPSQGGDLEGLVHELGHALGEAGGTTLALPLDPAHANWAKELTERLASTREGALEVWSEAGRDQALRRAVRRSTRVLVLVVSGAHSVFEVAAIGRLLGRTGQMGLVVLGLGEKLATVQDQVGDVPGFWRALSPPPVEPVTDLSARG